MTEKFLHYLWRMKLLKHELLFTTSGEKIQIVSCGDYNTNAGPDFYNAKVRIGATLWAGTVELHLRTSDWKKHKHQHDASYENVILHIVYEDDREKNDIPVLEIKDKFNENIFDNYSSLMASESWIPCSHGAGNVNTIIRNQWLQRLMIERMEKKTEPIIALLKENHNNWEETFYQFIAQAFGFKVNADPFRMMAMAVPLNILAKHKNSLFQIEALLFGSAGFLEDAFDEEYPQKLKKEFQFLKKKYQLQPIKKHMWKFLRLRPANFPTIRLAQFAQLVFSSTHLLSKILTATNVQEVKKFLTVSASGYWICHYRFGQLTSERPKQLGIEAIDLLLINTIIPMLFTYGKMRGEENYCDRALQFLEQISPEKNSIIRRWKESGLVARSAFDSQSLLQLKNEYCKNFRCLDCAIGHQLLRRS